MTVIQGLNPGWRKSQMRQGVKARPLNCTFETSLEKRCPNCGQNHLRPGYCQALDPINAAQYPHLHGVTAVTDNSADETDVTDNETPSGDVTDNVTDNPPVTDNGEAVSKLSVTCVVCEKPFESKRTDARYCSASCRQRARRQEAKVPV